MWGCAVGRPVSPVIVNSSIDHFEKATLSTSPLITKIWLRYVDDAFVIIPKAGVDDILRTHEHSASTHQVY